MGRIDHETHFSTTSGRMVLDQTSGESMIVGDKGWLSSGHYDLDDDLSDDVDDESSYSTDSTSSSGDANSAKYQHAMLVCFSKPNTQVRLIHDALQYAISAATQNAMQQALSIPNKHPLRHTASHRVPAITPVNITAQHTRSTTY